MFTILILFLILFAQNNCHCSELALPNKFLLSRNKGARVHDNLKLPLQCSFVNSVEELEEYSLKAQYVCCVSVQLTQIQQQINIYWQTQKIKASPDWHVLSFLLSWMPVIFLLLSIQHYIQVEKKKVTQLPGQHRHANGKRSQKEEYMFQWAILSGEREFLYM